MLKAAASILKQMRAYEEMDANIPTFGVGNVIDALASALEKEKIRRGRVKGQLQRSISLRKLEAILYRESGCVDPVDVPLLMNTFYLEAGLKPTQRLLDEVEESKRQLEIR